MMNSSQVILNSVNKIHSSFNEEGNKSKVVIALKI